MKTTVMERIKSTIMGEPEPEEARQAPVSVTPEMTIHREWIDESKGGRPIRCRAIQRPNDVVRVEALAGHPRRWAFAGGDHELQLLLGEEKAEQARIAHEADVAAALEKARVEREQRMVEAEQNKQIDAEEAARRRAERVGEIRDGFLEAMRIFHAKEKV